jgi:hypothetical protein
MTLQPDKKTTDYTKTGQRRRAETRLKFLKIFVAYLSSFATFQRPCRTGNGFSGFAAG